jgi:RNA polymerase sigma-70 factor, ECF subfamily
MVRSDDNLQDWEIVAEVRAGNLQAFGELIRRYQVKVRGYCFQMLVDRDLAEDAAQDIFFKAYRSLKTLKSDVAFSTWLYRITRNHCLDQLRKNARQAVESWEALLEQEGDRLQVLINRPAGSGAVIEDRELISKLLSCLPEAYREVIILREVQGLTYSEISKILDCSLDSVKARLRRARQELSERIRHF